MPFDGVFTNSIVNELTNYIDGKIDKIHQPNKEEIVLVLKKERKNVKLLFSANPSYPRVQITEKAMENPITPPTFCMVLRKYIQGGRIKEVKQINFDRIISFEIENQNELGYTNTFHLVCEIMGKHSNIFLLDDENKILDCIKHIDRSMNRHREVLPGALYILPPQGEKINPLLIQREDLNNLIKKHIEKDIDSFFTSSFLGVSRVFARNICAIYAGVKIKDLSPNQIKEVVDNYYYYLIRIKNNDYQYIIYFNEQSMIDFYVFPISEYKDLKPQYLESASTLLDLYYYQKNVKDSLKQKYNDIFKIINNLMDKNIKKQKVHRDKIEEVKDYDRWREFGDILIANQYQIKNFRDSITLENFYDNNNPVLIPLKTDLNIIENAQAYYKRYNKEKHGLEIVSNQLKAAEEENEYLLSVVCNLENATETDTVEEIKKELMELGYIKKKKYNQGKQKSTPHHFESSDGFDIYVGKNNLQNDYLTLKFAISSDIWLHTKNIPGSHVIIKSRNGSVSDVALLEGAMLAAFYSKGKSSSNVPVDYTERKNVKKPSGSKPGMVIYSTNKTIYVTPDENKISQIKKIK